MLAGELKSKLRPQACWEVHRSYDWGMYVRADVAQQMQLVPSPAGRVRMRRGLVSCGHAVAAGMMRCRVYMQPCCTTDAAVPLPQQMDTWGAALLDGSHARVGVVVHPCAFSAGFGAQATASTKRGIRFESHVFVAVIACAAALPAPTQTSCSFCVLLCISYV